MKIKAKDTVMVIAGKDKGKTGVVSDVFPKKDMLLLVGLNMKKKHMRPRKGGEKGQIIDKPSPLHISNVMLVEPDSKKPTRTGRKLVAGRFVRVSKKTGKEI